MDCSLLDTSVPGDSPGKNTGVGCHAFLQFQDEETAKGLMIQGLMLQRPGGRTLLIVLEAPCGWGQGSGVGVGWGEEVRTGRQQDSALGPQAPM